MSQIKVKRVTRESVLKKAMSVVCSDREKQYGSPEDNFDLISSFWYLYLKARRKRNGSDILNGHDVAVMMGLLKIARIATGEPKEDSYIDLAGYTACAGELSERDVI